jgi:hypothetical protein
MLQLSTTICLYPSTLICLYPSCGTCCWFRRCPQNHVPRSTFYAPDVHFLSFFASLSLLNHSLHTLKIAAEGSSVTAPCFALTMERLFSPCTRYRNQLESRGRFPPPDGLQELNLDVPTEELLSAETAFTYADLYAMLGNESTVAWLTPGAGVTREGGSLVHSIWGSCRIGFNADGTEIVALATSSEHLMEICDVVLRLLAASVVHSVFLGKRSSFHGTLINAPTLEYLMEQCQSLRTLSLSDLDMCENHFHVLGAYSRPDLEIELIRCKLTSAGTSALAEVLGRNQGPTKLTFCDIDYSILTDGLRENSRLKSLTLSICSDRDVGNQEVLVIAGALKENKGLVDLDLAYDFRMSDETWKAVCNSLKTHPTLEVLNIRSLNTDVTRPITVPALESRVEALLDMLKVNMSIHTIHLDSRYTEPELFRGSVIPYLLTNRFRPRLLAIQKSRPLEYRAKVLGRALLSARTNANSFWMLLSGNAEVTFSSKTTAIAAGANLPTAATAATVAAAVAASVMSALAPTAAGSLPTARPY